MALDKRDEDFLKAKVRKERAEMALEKAKKAKEDAVRAAEVAHRDALARIESKENPKIDDLQSEVDVAKTNLDSLI